MHVDRSRFLMLTTAIAAGACQPESPPQVPVLVAAPLDHAPSPRLTERPPASMMEEERGDPAGLSGSDEPSTDRTDPNGRSAKTGAEPRHRPSALVAECGRLQRPSAPHCEGFHWTQTLCEAFDRSLTRPVARAAVACLQRHSGRSSICSPDTREDCFAKAIGAAPATRHDRGRCAPIVSQCLRGGSGSKALTKANCRRAVAAVRPAFRDEMVTCIAESCGIGDCVYAIEP